MSSIIPANGYNLACTVQFLSLKLKALTSTFLPVLTNVDAMGVPASHSHLTVSLQTMSYYISNTLHNLDCSCSLGTTTGLPSPT